MLRAGLIAFAAVYGSVPSEEDGLNALLDAGIELPNWWEITPDGFYDVWGNRIVYDLHSGRICLRSAVRDLQLNTSDDIVLCFSQPAGHAETVR
jgi:hypothetical protein